MVAGFEVEFLRLFLALIHERDFKSSTTNPYPCIIFELCRAAGVPIWNLDVLRTPIVTVSIDLIRDEANEAAQNRGPLVEVQSLVGNL